MAFAPNGDLFFSGKLRGWMDLGAGLIGDTDGGFVARLSADDGGGLESRAMPGFTNPVESEVDAAGNLILGGSFADSLSVDNAIHWAAGKSDPFAVKLNGDLGTVWKIVGTAGERDDAFTAVTVGEGDAVFVGGQYHDSYALEGCPTLMSEGDSDVMLLKHK